MSDFVASEIRRGRREVERLKRRIACSDLPGKVHPGSQDYAGRTLRLELGKTADGKPILSPKIGWQQPGAGKLRMHTPPKDGEQMRLRSPSGTVGDASLADWATFDDETASPSQSADETVMEMEGESRARLHKDHAGLEKGDRIKARLEHDRVRDSVTATDGDFLRTVAQEKFVGVVATIGGTDFAVWIDKVRGGIFSTHPIGRLPYPYPEDR